MPTASITASAPRPPVRSRIASADVVERHSLSRSRRRAGRAISSRSGTRSTPITWSTPRCLAIRQHICADRTEAEDGQRSALRDVGVGHGLPRRGQHVGEEHEALVRRASGTLIGPNCAWGTRRYSACPPGTWP